MRITVQESGWVRLVHYGTVIDWRGTKSRLLFTVVVDCVKGVTGGNFWLTLAWAWWQYMTWTADTTTEHACGLFSS